MDRPIKQYVIAVRADAEHYWVGDRSTTMAEWREECQASREAVEILVKAIAAARDCGGILLVPI